MKRREFLGGTALGIASMAFAQEPVSLPPSERLNIAGIGLGGQGRGDIRRAAYHGHNIVALCDADWKEARHSFEEFPDAERYTDYRVMLEKRRDIDAVVIATPDHHHAFATVAALELDKHVYCEKPLTHSVEEARIVGDLARSKKLATQMGNTGQASESVRLIAEYIADGAIGPVREVHVWTDRPIWPQGLDRPKPPKTPHQEMNWDLWLGPAPERPFHSIYHPFRWRGWWDFGTGALGDIGCHRLDGVFRALNLGHPTSVEATSSKVYTETFPHASIIHYSFPARGEMPPVKITWYDGGLRPERPEELDSSSDLRDNGILYIGDSGKILDGQIIPESRRSAYTTPPKTLPRSIGHWEEWLSACKGEAVSPGSNFDFAGTLTEVVLLGNIALRTGKKLEWDGPNMNVTNFDDANALLGRAYRTGWHLKA